MEVNMFVEIHLIQNFAPSNLNRDDTNNPKDCIFGAARRARISSQCLKRAIRFEPHFESITGVPISHRTRLMASEIEKGLIHLGVENALAIEKAEEFSKHYSSKKAKLEDGKTNVMLFLSKAEINEIAENLANISENDEIKKYAEIFAKDTVNRPSAPDIAMFGRMLADRPETNVDAACQVAHAISTHAANMDIDFFTAIDDLQKEGDTGAGMMGVTAFNSACFYRYACIDFDQLLKNLNGDLELARRTIEAFMIASVHAIPSGKQNSYAAHNPPSFLAAVVRKDNACWSLANAFEKPVNQMSHKGLVLESVEALDKYWEKLSAFYGIPADPVIACLDGVAGLNSLKDYQVDSLEKWVEAVKDQLPQE
jgi:CRISPR system Cascade subunit CasC